MDYDILRCGAVADGVTNCAAAIQQAVDAAAAAGGGRVVVPAGRFLSGSVLLRDNVELHLESGAVLISSLNPDDIVPFPQGGDGTDPDDTADGWEGGFFLGASHAKNVTISGMGTIYGQGDKVFLDKDADNGFHECPKFCDVFRPRMMLFEAVENFTVRDVTLQDAAFWTLHMAGCRHVRIQNIRILNDDRGANNDGIDPDCCRDVVISNCLVRTGDDAIVVKSTGPMSRRYGASENVVITGCVLHSRDSALKIGTETHGAIRNVHVRNAEGWTRYSIAIEAVDGSVIDGVTYEDIRMSNCAAPFVVRLGNRGRTFEGGPDPASVGAIRNVTLRNIRNTGIGWVEVKGGPGVGTAVGGLKDHPIENVLIEDCDLLLFGSINEPQMIYRNVPENEKKYPEFDCYGTCPAYGLYFRHVDGLQVRNVRLRLANNDVRPAIVMDDVKNYALEDIDYESCSRTEPYGLWHQQDGEIRDAKK